MNVHKQFQIVCTGKRDQPHPLRELLLMYPEPPRNENGVWVGNADDLGKSWADWQPILERNRAGRVVYAKAATAEIGNATSPWVFHCKSCGPRHNRALRDDRLERMVMDLIASDVFVLDISNIPTRLSSS
jgi:hypothetical protein